MRSLATAVLAALLVALPAQAADDPRQSEQWGLAMVQAKDAWQTSTGVGALIAVIDSGVQKGHPDLAGRLVPGYDFVGSDPSTPGDEDSDPEDGNGHGTHVLGITVAGAGNGEGIAGVAPGAKALPLRVLDDDGGGFAEDTTKAIDRAIQAGADVINMSLGDFVPLQSAFFGDPGFEAAIGRALSKNIVVVLAAGNNGLPLCENPRVAGIICVGAVDNRGLRSAFSSFGSGVDLMGPGGSAAGGASEDVLSTYLKGTYEAIAGTSQATPHVAAVAALLVSLGVRGSAARARILATAKDAGAAGPDDQYGAGIVNAKTAVAGLGAPKPDPGNPNAPKGSYSSRSSFRAKEVSRKGIRVSCKPVRPGRCIVSVYYGKRRLAAGRADAATNSATAVVATATRAGKTILARVKKNITVTLRVSLPGEPTRTRALTIKP